MEGNDGWTAARALGLLAILTTTVTGCLDDTPLGPESNLSAFSLLGGLETGEALSLRGEEARSLRLPGGERGSEFVLVTFFGTEAEGSQVTVEIEDGDLVDVIGPPSASRRSASGPLDLDGPAIPGTAAFHRDLRAAEIRDLGPRLEGASWRDRPDSFQSGESDDDGGSELWSADPTAGPAAVPPAVGDTIPLRVITGAGSDICANWTEQAGRVAAVTEDVVMVSDTASPAELSDAQFQQFAQEFDQLVRPVEVEAFGEPTDIDDNDRVIVFFTPVVNQQGAGGFTFTGDLFPREDCEASNEGEIFYIISPDPTGEANPAIQVTTETVARLATGIIGHEFQHLINAGRRIYVNQASSLESVWMNEGLSHIAEELLFYEQTSLGPGQNITLNTLESSSEIAESANRFMVENLFRYAVFSAVPTESTFLGSDNTATRGSAWSFLRYAADQEENPDFFFELVNSTTRGMANLGGVLESSDPLELYQAWTASVFSDDHLSDLPPFLTQPSWNHRTILPFFTESGDFPLNIQVIDGAGPIQVSLTGGAAAFFRVGVEPAGIGEFRIDASGTAPEDLRVSVVRAD